MKLEEIAKMAIDEVAMELKQMSAAQENLDAREAENAANLGGIPTSSGDVNLTNAAGLANLVGEISVADEVSEFEATLDSAVSSQKTATEFDAVQESALSAAPSNPIKRHTLNAAKTGKNRNLPTNSQQPNNNIPKAV